MSVYLFIRKHLSLIFSLLVSLLTDSSSTLWLILLAYQFYTSQFGVNHNTATVFANDNLLTHTDIQLTLRWNLVEATATSLDRKSVV